MLSEWKHVLPQHHQSSDASGAPRLRSDIKTNGFEQCSVDSATFLR